MSIEPGEAVPMDIPSVDAGVPVPAMTGRAHAPSTTIPFDDAPPDDVDVLVDSLDPHALSDSTMRIETGTVTNQTRRPPMRVIRVGEG